MRKKKQDQQIIANPPKNDKQVAFESVWLAGDGKKDKFQDDSFDDIASFDNPNPFDRTHRNIVKEPAVQPAVDIVDSDEEIDFAAFENPDPFNSSHRDVQWPKEQKPFADISKPVPAFNRNLDGASGSKQQALNQSNQRSNAPKASIEIIEDIDLSSFENPNPFSSSHRDVQSTQSFADVQGGPIFNKSFRECLPHGGPPIPGLDFIVDTSLLDGDEDNFFDDVEDDPVAPGVPQRPKFGPLVVGRNKIDIYELLMNQNTRPEK